MQIWERLGWVAVGLSVIILMVFGAIRLTDMVVAPSTADAFEVGR